MKTLNDYARENNLSYTTSWRRFRDGLIEGAEKDAHGNIIIQDTTQSLPPPETSIPSDNPLKDSIPAIVDFESGKVVKASTRTRSNDAAFIESVHRFENIKQSFTPFQHGINGQAYNNSNLNIQEVTILVQKAYWSFSIVKAVLETLRDFSSSKIYLTGGNKKARDFFEAYFNKIGLLDFTKEFFLVFYREANCFIYPMMGELSKDDLVKLRQAFGATSKNDSVSLPVRYILLNPSEIQLQGSSSFVSGIYQKVITDYELERLRNPRTQEDQEIFDSFDVVTQQEIKEKKNSQVIIPLDNKKIYAVFNGKTSFEPFAISPLFGILDDLEQKLTYKKLDKAVATTFQQALLHIKVGVLGKDGEVHFNQKTVDYLQQLFSNPSAGKVLVSDFTVESDFKTPNIGDVLDPKKYQILQQDLIEGLNSFMFSGTGGEKFSNTSNKIDIFVEKLKSAREVFLSSFLIPEIKKISQLLGFRSLVIPHFQEVDLKNSDERKRIAVSLSQLGFLTPEEAFEAMQTGRLPTSEESMESQKAFKEAKDEGLYQPPAGGTFAQMEVQKQDQKFQEKQTDKQLEHDAQTQKRDLKHQAENPAPKPPAPIHINLPGRPSGTKKPKTKQKVTPVGKGSVENPEDNE